MAYVGLKPRGRDDMFKRFVSIAILAAGLAACTTETTTEQLAVDGKPIPKFYNLAAQNEATVQYRMLDAVNALRNSVGVSSLSLNAQLNAAAATHSRDMSIQNRPWHFGSDGSSPLDRVNRVGYPGILIGETISETYENELDTLSAWMSNKDTRFVILDPQAIEMGVAWFQEPNGKIWWTLVTGGQSLSSVAVTDE